MPIVSKEVFDQSKRVQDIGRLTELDSHELLRADDTSQIASFDEIRTVGRWFLDQDYNAVLPSNRPLPPALLTHHELHGNNAFLGKLALGPDLESHFPVTMQVIATPTGKDLRVHIVPIHFGALEVAQFGMRSDSLLALAAAAAVAPQFILALEGGIETTACSTKKEMVTSITPDHGTPLAVTFDSFELGNRTLQSAIGATGNANINIKQAAHLHGQAKPSTQQISRAAAGSKIAAGVPITSTLRSDLPRHALFISTFEDPITGAERIVSMHESLIDAGIMTADLSFLAAALGFTARVVGDTKREQTVEKVLSPSQAETPLREIFSA